MTNTSKLDEAIDKLLGVAEAALPSVAVVDGLRTGFEVGEWLVIGGDGPVDEEEEAARSSQSWKGLGAMIRDESIDVTCAAGSSTGNAENAMKPRRDAVFAVMREFEAALRADPGLGGFTTGGAACVTDTALRYVNNAAGYSAVLVFTINVPVRI